VVLFGRLKLADYRGQQVGQIVNIGWTVGEEILFKQADGIVQRRTDKCVAVTDSCVLGFEKKALRQIKHSLESKGLKEEFRKLEVVIRGNYLVKKGWR
jgi:hypothetical protein